MGLPIFQISFETNAIDAIGLATRGFVVVAIKDASVTDGDVQIFKNFAEVSNGTYDATNYKIIEDIFKGSPTKVKVVATTLAKTFTGVSALLLQDTPDVDYLVAPEFTADNVAIISWIGDMRNNGAKIKGVLAGTGSNKEYIVDTEIGGVIDREGVAVPFPSARIGGVLAGLDPTRSATYFVLPEWKEVTAVTDPGASIEGGHLVAINDGSKIKIARGVNSFVSVTATKGPLFQKIKNIETMDMISFTIRKVVEDDYIGKVANSLDNKNLIVTAVNQFLGLMANNDYLNPSYDNSCSLDLQAHLDYAELNGVNTEGFTETQIKKIDTGDNIYLIVDCKLLDAIEDVTIKVFI